MLIGEVSRLTGISARMLRHYDELGLVSPGARTSGGYRDYSEDDLRLLLRVEALRSIGFSLAFIGQTLAEGSAGLSARIDEQIRETKERIRQDRELLRRLQLVRAADPAGTKELIHLLGVLQQLRSADPATRFRAALSEHESAPGPALTEALLREEDDSVAGALQWALEHSGVVDLAVIRRALESKNPQVRRRAVALLAGEAGTGALLAELVDDADDVVRARATLALARRSTPDMIPRLLDMIVEGLQDVEAAEVLGELAGGDAVGEISRLLSAPGTSAEARLRLVQALAEIPGSGEVLAELTRDEDRVVAGTAGYILGELG